MSDTKRSTIWLKAVAAAPVLLIDTGVPLSPPAETLGSKGIEPRRGTSISVAKRSPPPSPKTGQLVPSGVTKACLLYTSPSPRDVEESRMPSSA